MLGVPVIPVAVNSGIAYPPHLWVKWPGTITYRIGETIPAGLPRVPALPEVPTFDESGISNFYSGVPHGIFVRVGTPAAIVQRYNTEFNRIIGTPEMKKRMIDNGYEPMGGPADPFGAHIRAEIANWAPVVKSAHIRVD